MGTFVLGYSSSYSASSLGDFPRMYVESFASKFLFPEKNAFYERSCTLWPTTICVSDGASELRNNPTIPFIFFNRFSLQA